MKNHYYYYEFTSNSKFKVIKKKVKNDNFDNNKLVKENYFIREKDAEKEGNRVLKELTKAFSRK